MADQDTMKIEKLQGQGQWNSWKFQIRIWLRASDLFDIVSGVSKLPVPSSADAKVSEIKKWKISDSSAQRVIVTTIGQQPLTHVMNCLTSAEMWTKLHSVYEQKSSASIHLLQHRFYGFTMDPKDGIASHISKLEEMSKQLNDLGEGLPESMVMTKILMTLPPEYNHFYSAWESTPKEKQTLDELTSRLMIEESRMHSQNAVADGSDALFAKKFGPGNQNKNKKYNRNKVHGKCFHCNKSGHFKRDCPSREKDMSGGQKPNEAKGGAFIGELLAAASRTESWFLDSGASDHMCYNRDWYVVFEHLPTPLPVRVGNGEVILAHGRGDINISAYDGKNWIAKHLKDVLYVPDIQLNLFSSGCAMDKGLKLFSDESRCEIKSGEKTVAIGVRENRLYKLLFKVMPPKVSMANSAVKESLQVWHERLGHQNLRYVKSFLKDKNISYVDKTEIFCEACVFGKSHRESFNIS